MFRVAPLLAVLLDLLFKTFLRFLDQSLRSEFNGTVVFYVHFQTEKLSDFTFQFDWQVFANFVHKFLVP